MIKNLSIMSKTFLIIFDTNPKNNDKLFSISKYKAPMSLISKKIEV